MVRNCNHHRAQGNGDDFQTGIQIPRQHPRTREGNRKCCDNDGEMFETQQHLAVPVTEIGGDNSNRQRKHEEKQQRPKYGCHPTRLIDSRLVLGQQQLNVRSRQRLTPSKNIGLILVGVGKLQRIADRIPSHLGFDF